MFGCKEWHQLKDDSSSSKKPLQRSTDTQSCSSTVNVLLCRLETDGGRT